MINLMYFHVFMHASPDDSCTESKDISSLPNLTFAFVEKYAKELSGCQSTAKAYKFFAEPGYLHEMKVTTKDDLAVINARCYRSMKKNEPPHVLETKINIVNSSISARCSCVAGVGGYCHHVVGLLFFLAHCKQLGLRSLPDSLTCTSMPQRWSVPRGKKIEQKKIQDVLVKKPRAGANFTKFIKSTLYSPSNVYLPMTKENFDDFESKPLIASILPSEKNLASIPHVQSKFGEVPKGCVLSYQQKLSQDYVINDFSCTNFPTLPLASAEMRFKNNCSSCLTKQQQASLDAIMITQEESLDIQEKTITQSANSLWHMLRSKRITASKFGIVARRSRDFENLVKQLNPSRHVITAAMKRGIDLESTAAMAYANVAKNGSVNLFPSGLIIHPRCPWLGCSPDRLVYDLQAAESCCNPFGLLEIKVVKEGENDFANVRYLSKNVATNDFILKNTDIYFYQVQCQLALTGLEWCDFFSYISDTHFVCNRIKFNKDFFKRQK
ncbi:uncharacterized protein LOC124435961 [Xenia sp. Carnegie-2017]|uniref:uncharacterized protein LOC124435961 n=1 Tax=Xenia sp. Carnegie-2017 TaxID=2897299 RepID=UPI001F038795|nr:uncharacterized protein LOC124435961 [Xenia sp. Carnegie-2017]